MIRFGPSGHCTIETPKYLSDIGLNAVEINFGRGVRLSNTNALSIGEQARKYNISISAHAPYYINLCSGDKENIKKSYGYIKQSLDALQKINSSDGKLRLVMHVGFQCKLTREQAIANAKKNLIDVIKRLSNDGLDNFLLCIETMGRYKAIGNVEEICDICSIADCIVPAIDFGHINAWEQGMLHNSPEKIREIIEYCCDKLGDKMKRPHIHFSSVIYTKAGEHAHTTLDDEKWSFSFKPLANIIREKKLEPIIICESKQQTTADALVLKNQYLKTV